MEIKREKGSLYQALIVLIFYLIIPFCFGITLSKFVLFEYSFSVNTIQWLFASSFQAFVALLGLIGLIIAFKIQHRDQIREIQSSILIYSKEVLMWHFAGFDIDEIKRKKDDLFLRFKNRIERMPEGQLKQDDLDAFPFEKTHFEKMLKNYSNLDIERKQIYDKLFCPFYLIIAVIIISLICLLFSDELWHYPSIIIGSVSLIIWSILSIGRFLICMMIRESEIKLFVNFKDKT